MLRSILLYLSRSEGIRTLMTRSGVVRRMALRFVAGETIEGAVAATREINGWGASAEMDCLGENVRSRSQAEAAAAAYITLLERVAEEKVDAQVSLKLTQMGLDLGTDLCRDNVGRVVQRATELHNFVWVDIESSDYVDRTLQIYRGLRERHDNVGIAIQSYLRRSKADLHDLLAIGGAVRLVKGAYVEPPEVAFPDKRDVDRNFALLADILLASGRFHAIATHDERLVGHVVEFARTKGIDPRSFEFQFLYGVRRDLQRRLLSEGYRVRVYVPYGSEWYPYLMRRLAERPANVLFLLSNLLREARAS